jgi:hypothetical protein
VAAAKAQWADPAYRASKVAAAKTQTAREQNPEIALAQWADPAARARLSETHKRRGIRVPPDSVYKGGPTKMEVRLLEALPAGSGCTLHHEIPHGSGLRGFGMWIVDLALLGSRLTVEIDGDSHRKSTQKAIDRRKEEFLLSRGLRVIRVSNESVLADLEGVVTFITSVAARPAAVQEARPF